MKQGVAFCGRVARFLGDGIVWNDEDFCGAEACAYR